ncbi:MAG: hypothetical protein ACI8S6_001357 [Myxococcota bacterium]|jgi:hypothetical protein
MSSITLLTIEGVRLLLDRHTGRIGAAWPYQPICWSEVALPLPVRAVSAEADVGYLHMWSGILEVDLPALLSDGALRCWLVDGEEQPARVTVLPGQAPQVMWP